MPIGTDSCLALIILAPSVVVVVSVTVVVVVVVEVVVVVGLSVVVDGVQQLQQQQLQVES